MMNEMVRRPCDPQYSPKSSPRGSRSPASNLRQDSTGTLKTTISLGKTPTIVHSGPFYLMKEPPGLGLFMLNSAYNHVYVKAESELTGATNLLLNYNLEHSYNKFCCGRKMKDQLSAFLPNLPGNIDTQGSQDNSALQSLIDRPPIGGKEISQLLGPQLQGFRLHPGPLPEPYRLMHQPAQKKKHKQKKNKHKPSDTPSHDNITENLDSSAAAAHEKKHKKQRKHDEEKERKKKKKEKKKKKQRHSPEQDPLSI